MIELVRGTEGFAAIQHDWNELYRRSGSENPFLTHAWLANWLAAFGEEKHVAILSRRGGELKGGLVARQAGSGFTAIEAHTYWSEVLNDGEESLALLFDHCARQRAQRMELHGPEVASYRERLTHAAAGKFVVLAKNPWVTRCITVAASLDAYLATRDGKTRSELRRKMRRFGERAPAAEVSCYGADRRAEAIAIVEAVERQSWKLEAGTAIASSARDVAFYRGIFSLESNGGTPLLYALEQSGEPIAFVFGVRHQRRFYALKTSFREPWADLAPGLVLFCKLIALMSADGSVASIELLGRDSRWKREMATDCRNYCVYELLACDMSTRLYSMAHTHVRPLIARLQQARAKE